jgi:hypothetical protein
MKTIGVVFFCLFVLVVPFEGRALTLADCGTIVGHEMGLWEFFSTYPSPRQVDRVLKSKLKFVKISLRQLKDGEWVVSHDPTVSIYPGLDGQAVKVTLQDISWQDVENWRAIPGAFIPIYRLRDYIARDQGRLCWMFSPKVNPDPQLVNEILELGIQDRAVLLTGGLSDVQFYSSFPREYNLHFAGRVGDQEQDLAAYQPYVDRLWAMEIDPTKNAPRMIELTHQMNLPAYVDSMRYSWNYELLGTACKKVFKMGAQITQTNRPLQCMHQTAAQ